MSVSTAAWLIPLALIYFMALLVVAFEPHESHRRARHRLDTTGPAGTARDGAGGTR
ncbi:MAG: hypothetical protein ACRDTE_16490 [Pseudonocardiaceae bacterium]